MVTLAALLGGVVFASATPPADLFIGIFLGLAGFAWAVREKPIGLPLPARAALRSGATCGFLFGASANLFALRFIPAVVERFTDLPAWVGLLALVLLALAQALPWALGGALARWLQTHARLPLPLAFATGVYAAIRVPQVFPWTPAGGLASWPTLLQSAEFIGEKGASFLLALVSALVVEGLFRARTAWHKGARAGLREGAGPTALSALLLAGLAAFGTVRMRAVDNARAQALHVDIALVQPGFDAGDRWDPGRAEMMLERLTALTKSGEQRGARLTIWPESAYPYALPHAARTSPDGRRAILQPGVVGPVLTGVYMVAPSGESFNAAVLASDGGALSEPYDKRHLLWFGETIPLADELPWLRKVFARGPGLIAGHDSTLLSAGPIRAAVLNCYEDTLGSAGREAMEHAPNLLVNITNDAWFVGSREPELHLRLSVLRAIETRRDLVRAVNRGPTSFIDAAGRVQTRYDGPVPAAVIVAPALLEGSPTLFTRFGDAPLTIALGLYAACAWANARPRRRRP